MSLPRPASSSLVRYGAPLVLLVASLALSLLAQTQVIGPKLGLMPTPFALWLLPAVSVLVYLGVRLSGGTSDRNSDLLLTWVAVFPLMLHVLHLLFALGVFVQLDRGMSIVAATLHVGLAVLVPGLPPGSAYGLRLRGTMGSERAWRHVHRRLGFGFWAAAVLAATTVWLPPRGDLIAFLGGPAIALGMGFIAAFWPRDEDPGPESRPSPGQSNPGEHESSP